jgi:hypothetical protein
MEMIQQLGMIARIDCSDDIRLEVIEIKGNKIPAMNI